MNTEDILLTCLLVSIVVCMLLRPFVTQFVRRFFPPQSKSDVDSGNFVGRYRSVGAEVSLGTPPQAEKQ